MKKPEWEQKLPAGYRMATEADRGTPIGRDWKAWMTEWEPIRQNVVGAPLDPWTGNGSSHVPMCMPISSVLPGISLEQATENIHRAMGKAEAKIREVYNIPAGEHTDYTEAARFVDVAYDTTLVELAELIKGVPPATGASIDALANLKPFTPNKYTRYMPTLDGRKVPVDVYCVLAAFPTGSSAVDHAVKKLLAPGQRGHKDRIQDLKEARDSLTRAIELEEANAP